MAFIGVLSFFLLVHHVFRLSSILCLPLAERLLPKKGSAVWKPLQKSLQIHFLPRWQRLLIVLSEDSVIGGASRSHQQESCPSWSYTRKGGLSSCLPNHTYPAPYRKSVQGLSPYLMGSPSLNGGTF